jgi:hypothetical protein
MIAILILVGCMCFFSVLAGVGGYVYYNEEATKEAKKEAEEEAGKALQSAEDKRLAALIESKDEKDAFAKEFEEKIKRSEEKMSIAEESLKEAIKAGDKSKELEAIKEIENSNKLHDLNVKLKNEADSNKIKATKLLEKEIELKKSSEAEFLLSQEIELSKIETKRIELEHQLALEKEGDNSKKLMDELKRVELSITEKEEKVIEAQKNINENNKMYSSILNSLRTKKRYGGNGKARYLDKHDIKCSDKNVLNGFLLRTSGKDIYYDYTCLDGDFEKGIRKQTESTILDSVRFLDRHDVKCGSDSLISRAKLTNKNGKWNYDYTCSKSKNPLQCRNLSTTLNDSGNGKNHYLDRHQLKCNSDEGLGRFKLVNKGTKKYRYDYTCCKFPKHSIKSQRSPIKKKVLDNGKIQYSIKSKEDERR